MSVLAEAVATLTAEILSHVPMRTLRRMAGIAVRGIALAFYFVGRAVLKLLRAPKSETGVPEAVVGFMIVAGLAVALIKLPARLAFAGLMR